jgi:hypothetical protein
LAAGVKQPHPGRNQNPVAFAIFRLSFYMRIPSSGLLRYAAALLVMALLCSAHGDGKSAKWKKFTKIKQPVIVKELDFGKGSVLSVKQMLMWGEWVISFKVDSLPHLKPYAPVPEYAGKAFAIEGLQAYSNHNGPAHAEIIYDGRPGHHTWDIDIWKTRTNDVGEPVYHMSFFINGPVSMVVSK